MKLAVTGASGFLARHFVSAAASAGHDVFAFTRQDVLPSGDCTVRTLGSYEELSSADFAGMDGLVHLASAGVQSRGRVWDTMIRSNTLLTVQLLDKAAEAGVSHLVFAGTCLEYQGEGSLPEAPAPIARLLDETATLSRRNSYAATKAAGSVLLSARAREMSKAAWYLRFASMYGLDDDGDKFIPSVLRAARANEPFPMSGGEQVREWLWVEDAVRALLSALEHNPPEANLEIVNVGTELGIGLYNVARKIFDSCGSDHDLIRPGALEYRSGEAHRIVMSSATAVRRLEWKSEVTLDDGLQILVANSLRFCLTKFEGKAPA